MTLVDSPALDYLERLPQDSPFTTTTARAEGVTDNTLADLVRLGTLRRPVRSVYLLADVPDTLASRLAMLKLVVPPGCFVTDHTAAWLHVGDAALLPNAHIDTSRPDIFRHSQARALRNPLVRSGERAVSADDLMVIEGLEVTSHLRTAADLGRLQTGPVALWGLDCMLGTGEFQREELLAALPRWRAQRGIVQLRELAPIADGLAASFGEAGTRWHWYGAGLPRPRLQIPVTDGGRVIAFLDMGLEDEGFAAEYDGARWHDGPEAQRHDEGRRTWLREERDWWIEVFRQVHVFGTRQDADARLRAGYRALQDARATRTIII